MPANIQGKKIYLALPYSHSNPEIRKARFDIATAVSVSLMKQGAVVFSPITYSHQFCQYGIGIDFNTWADFDYSMIDWADELWLLEINGFECSFGVRKELEKARQTKTPVVRISQNKLFNLFSSDTSLNNHSPLNVAASALSRIAEVRYEFTVKSKYKYGDSIFIIDDNNEIQEQEVTEIAIAFIQGSQTISYNGFHSKLVFASYDAAKKALEANFI